MKNQPNKDNTFCYYPFHEITLKMWEGEKLAATSPCCMMFNTYNEGLQIENMDLKTPEELFNSKEMQQLRKDALKGVRNPLCDICWKLEDNGQTSFRMYSLPQGRDSMPKKELKNPQLATIDITLSNVCNLRCRMCDVSNSNRLNIDFDILEAQGTRNEFANITGAMAHKYPRKEAAKSKQFEWLYENTHKIKTLKASGGEPFYDKHIIRLLEQYIKTGAAQDTTLHFHTNATMIDDRVIDIIKHFKKNFNTFSIDGTDKVYEYIRHEADWNILNKNVKNYAALDNVELIDLNMVVTAHNLHNVPDYVNWAKKLQKKINIVYSEVYPQHRGIHISSLPNKMLKDVHKKISNIDEPEDRDQYLGLDVLKEFVEKAMDVPENIKKGKQKKLYRETVILDAARNQSYKDYLYPQMVNLLDKLKKLYD